MARKEKTIHYLYKTTCLITGRYYIGMHSTSNLNDGYMGSGKRLRYSIRKHGKENHVKEILEFFESRELLIEAEKKVITSDMIIDADCMNLADGGSGGHGSRFLTKEQLIKGRDVCDKILKEKYGENFKSVIIKNYYKNLTEDEKLIRGKNISNAQKESGFDFGLPFRGKKHSDETKNKMSESSKGQGVGEQNSQYGTCWITKEGVNKKIKKDDFETYLNEGWLKGRK